MKVMFISAHPDDIELGAGGTLIKHIRRGDQVFYVVLSRGEKGGDPVAREREVLEIIDYLGIKIFKLCDYPDTLLNTKFNDIKDELEQLIREYGPVRIYTHSLNDTHQDHRAVAEAVKVAGRRIPQILSFWSPHMYNNFNPNYFIDITDVFMEKIKLLEKYKSQGHKDYLKREIIKGINKYFGFISGVDYAEGFEIVRYREI